MTAPVRIEKEAWGDLRFATLARLLKLADADHALIKVARIWAWQTEHYTPEAPTYVVDQDTIESALGTGGAAAMVRARLAEEVPEGFRIKGGTPERIEWLWKKRHASVLGGESTKNKWKAKGRPSEGQLASECEDDNKEGPRGLGVARPNEGQAKAEGRPNEGPLTPTLVLDQRSCVDPDQGARPSGASPDQGGGGDRAQRTRLVNRFLTRVNAARVEVATEHNLGPHRPVTLMDGGGSGERELCARIAASTDPERDLEHVLDVAIAEAHERGELRWLSWSLASERSWRSRLAASVAEAGPRRSARKAGEAIGAARPRADHPDAPGLKTFGELS